MFELTDQNFENEIKNSSKPVLIDFFAEWCPPCKMLSPVLEKLEGEFKDRVIFAKVNVDACPQTAQKFGINPIPTVILLKGGQAAANFVGLRPEEEIRSWLENSLK
jgi:thioredoxin 1